MNVTKKTGFALVRFRPVQGEKRRRSPQPGSEKGFNLLPPGGHAALGLDGTHEVDKIVIKLPG
ncbi:MAG: hypothetical protein LUC87_03545 [Clostridiales bacterium]|nr:hypothetical protein [Clostridiales bacterium]